MISSVNAIKLFRLCKKYLNISIRGTKLYPYKQFSKKSHQKKGLQIFGDVYLQAIGTGAYDQPSTLYLFTPNRSYLFNCTENSGRLIKAINGLSIGHIEHIFLTQLKWNNIGGIGALLYQILSKSGHFPTFHGPARLFHIIKELTSLSMIGNAFKCTLTPKIIDSIKSFEDDCISIDIVELSKNNNHTNSISNTDVVYTYVCKIKSKPAVFSLEKSVEKNVPPELFKKIFNGEDITLDDGTIVKAVDVRSSPGAEKYFMVIDIPSKDFLANLKDNKRIKELLDNIGPKNLDLIVHFTSDDVFKTKEYQEFISQSNAKRHSLMNDTNRYSALPNVNSFVTKLHFFVDQKIHPLLAIPSDPDPVIYDPNSETADENDTAPKLYTKFIFHAISEKKFINDEMNAIAMREMENSKINGINNINLQNELDTTSNEVFPNVVFLGTGSACSQLNRNSSGILVNISENNSILLDCGEGICSQIHRFYGSKSLQIFRRIKAIFVSHSHLDHHIGLPEMFRMRNIYLPKFRTPLLFIGPVSELKPWLNFYSNEIDDIKSDMLVIENERLHTKEGLRRNLCKRIGIESLRTCQVRHHRNSHAVTINIPINNEIFKLTYSGDTEWCDELTQLAQSSTLLIHEATFQDDLEVMARQKRHSTISTAILQAQKSHSKYTILTHFSARYQNIPFINGHLPDRIGIAFDFMRVTLDDLPRLNSLYPKYRNIFRADIEDLERKTVKYTHSWNTSKVKL